MADKKFSPMRYSASTEEAAINGALQIVGVSREEIEIEVLEQTEKGVTVRIKPRSSDAPVAPPVAPVAEQPVDEPADEPEDEPVDEPVDESTEEPIEFPFMPSSPSLDSALFIDHSPEHDSPEHDSPIAEDVPELLAQDEEPDTEVEAQLGDGPDTYNDDFAEATPGFDAEVEGEEAEGEEVAPAPPVVEQDPAVIERARATAQDFLERMGLEASAHVGRATDAGTVALVIEGDDVGILIGKHGATLQSFQYLLNLTLNAHSEGEGTRVVVDAGNYRARRQSSLEQTARSAASKARRENRAVRLEPMPAHERRLVHMFLQTESDIATQSEGREPMRRIVVAPASGARPSAPRAPRPLNGEKSFGNDRSFGERRESGMGSYGRRGDANSERNRGFNRGR